jgi:dihydrofolate reductase
MNISVIAAMSSNRVIGNNNSLPWKLPDDLKRFRDLTMNHCLIMGRKTFESIGRPLKGRELIVVTRQPGYSHENIRVCHSLEEAIQLAERIEQNGKIFIAGGAQIYAQTLTLADEMYLTFIHKEFPGDAYFPQFNDKYWQLTEDDEKIFPSDEQSLKYSFRIYNKIGTA